MVSGTRDNPPPETSLESIYMWKWFPYRPNKIKVDPACPATAIYEALSHFLYFDTCIKIIVVGNCIKGKVSYKEFYWIFWTLEF